MDFLADDDAGGGIVRELGVVRETEGLEERERTETGRLMKIWKFMLWSESILSGNDQAGISVIS